MAGKVYDDQLSARDVYQIEDMVARMVREGGTVDFHGSQLWLGNCRIYDYTPKQQHILQGIVTGLYLAHRRPGRPDTAPLLRISTRAHRRAWYSGANHEIVLPSMRWALNDLVVAHEIAHACVGTGHDQRSSHGKTFRRVYAAIVTDRIGPEAGLLLLDAFAG